MCVEHIVGINKRVGILVGAKGVVFMKALDQVAVPLGVGLEGRHKLVYTRVDWLESHCQWRQ